MNKCFFASCTLCNYNPFIKKNKNKRRKTYTSYKDIIKCDILSYDVIDYDNDTC